MLICSLFFSSLLFCSTPTPPPYIEVCVRVTCYEPTGYRTASMKVPKNGMVASSDRGLKFGTNVEIDGNVYVVEDRTSYCLIPGEKCEGFRSFDKHTIDIFSEEGCENFEGTKNKLVKIYK